MQNLGEPRVMSIYEFASALGLAHQTIRTWAHEGRIATVKLGRRRMVVRSELERVLAENLAPALAKVEAADVAE